MGPVWCRVPGPLGCRGPLRGSPGGSAHLCCQQCSSGHAEVGRSHSGGRWMWEVAAGVPVDDGHSRVCSLGLGLQMSLNQIFIYCWSWV